MTQPTATDGTTPSKRRRARSAARENEPGAPSPRRRPRHESEPAPHDELLAELRALDTILGEVLDRVGERLRTRLAAISATVAGPTGRQLGAKRVDALRRAIRAVNVKPVKARVKDLVRLRDLLDALQELLSGEP